MPKITIKDFHGEEKAYTGSDLKIWRDGNTVEIYYNKPLEGGREYRKVIVAVATNAARVDVDHEKESRPRVSRETDPFTAAALEERKDTPEEKELLDAYRKIERKKRGRPRKNPLPENEEKRD